MPISITAARFKTHCLQLLDEVYRRQASVVITKRGKSMAMLVPYQDKARSLFGCMKNSVIIKGDIVKNTGEKWDADT